MQRRYQRIAVLYGGLSREREVSLAGGTAIAEALTRRGYDVHRVDAGRDVDRHLRRIEPDAAFIALHGRLGEDGTVQGMLEMMGIPYTGSPVFASAAAMDKVAARTLFAAAGLRCAPGAVVRTADAACPLPFPVVVKPATEGSSVGVALAESEPAYRAALQHALECADAALVESFVRGTEIQVAILDDAVLGAVEIETGRAFYDYEAKYAPGGSTHHIPPRIPPQETARCADAARRAYETLGCAGAARVDLIHLPHEDPVVLEVNTIPGMTPTSLLPEIAAHAGLSFDDLVERIVESARLHTRV